MKYGWLGTCLAVAIMAQSGPYARGADSPSDVDLRRAIPTDVFMAVYGRHNPERDYQGAYYEEVLETIKDTKIVEQAVNIVTKRLEPDDLAKAEAIVQELRDAVSPIDLQAVLACQQIAYAQKQRVPSSDHLLLLQLTTDGAAGLEQGLTNLFQKAEQFSDRQVWVESSEQRGAKVTSLRLPPRAPISPTIARWHDTILIATSRDLAVRSLEMLIDQTGPSKFDDPRVEEALSHLPTPEDAIVFYDGKLHMQQLRQFGDFIRQNAQGENADRARQFLERILHEVSIMDYEITVEFTEGNKNCSAAYGRVLPNTEDRVLSQVLTSGQPFEDWASWVPAESLSYSLHRGISLHPVHDWIMKTVPEEFPEAREGLSRFEELQESWDLHIDRDILQSFSGEFASISMAASSPNGASGQESVNAFRCQNPDRIRELMHRGLDRLAEHPMAKAQELRRQPVEELEGFEEISALFFNMFNARPVIGFHDGWMIVGSSPQAVQKVLDTRAGQGETMAQSEAFQRFGLSVTGPVSGIAYTDTAAQTRQIAQMLNRVGMLAPGFIAMMGAQGDPKQLEVAQEVVALLPSVGRIISKLDFLEAKLAVSQPGEDPLTYEKRTVLLVRPPAEE